MDQAAQGKKAIAASEYQQAIEHFTAALKVSPTSPDYLIQRSTAHQRTKNYDAALHDANAAVLSAYERAKRELIIEAQLRRGCALYSLERYGDAEFVFGVVQRMNAEHKMVPTWTQKTKMALNKLGAADEKRKCTVTEMPDAEDTTTSPTTTAAATNSAGRAAASQPVSSAPAAPQPTPSHKIRHEWYQSTENVYFTLLAKGIPADKAQIDIHERSLSISFPLPAESSSYDLTLDPLFGPVNPEKCIKRVLATKLEVILSKATAGVKWNALEGDAAESTKAGAGQGDDDAVKRATIIDSRPAGPAYPTSSKSGPKDWDKVVSEARKAESNGKEPSTGDADDDEEGGDAANAFFKNLYKNASPDVQRAMMKSYTESNGTSLSTNWEEVSKAPVETAPPDGMEAKKW